MVRRLHEIKPGTLAGHVEVSNSENNSVCRQVSWRVVNNIMAANVAEQADCIAGIRVSPVLKCEAVELIYTTFPDIFAPFDFLDAQRGMIAILLKALTTFSWIFDGKTL
jgi:hypothetical protein